MNREERLSFLSVISWEKIHPLAVKVIRKYKVEIIKKNLGLVMAKAVDSVEEEAFYLGEVLVSEAMVEVKGNVGYACFLSRDTDKAVKGATIDSICCFDESFREEIDKVIEEEKNKWEKEREKEMGKVLSTKVEFERMAER